MRVQGLALISLALAGASAAAMAQTNSAGFYYQTTFQNIDSYKQPTALLITGECNRGDAQFADARTKGAEVLAYINVVERQDAPTNVCGAYADLYTLPTGLPASNYDPGTPYARFWQSPQPKQRINWVGSSYTTYLLDITSGSAWSNRVVAYVEQLMREDKVDGVFLDVLGARLWGVNTDWRNEIPVGGEAQYAADHDLGQVPAASPDWTTNERNAWTAGAIDLVRRLDASRQAINPNFIIVNNNNWAGNWPGSTYGEEAEQYVDGIAIEHKASTEAAQVGYAGRAYAARGHRRVIAIAKDTDPSATDNRQAEERAWRNVEGVTHTTSQPSYAYAPAPTTPTAPTKTFARLTDRLDRDPFGRIHESTVPSAGMTADKKRATRFLLSKDAVLLTLWAYLDGGGEVTSGQQPVRLALYKDDHGVPGEKVTESETKWFGPGQVAAWRPFSVPQDLSLISGYYWIAIHTGATGGIARNFGDGSGAWVTNTDAFGNGADAPFGTVELSGTTQLSVYATYRFVQ
ncbi:MAG TPA: hypothetical protein VMF52_18155 [Steroidobacteraceae bacterium]|nr:hypothetical protein [Steroidobacteraceae bacterium]